MELESISRMVEGALFNEHDWEYDFYIKSSGGMKDMSGVMESIIWFIIFRT